MKMKKGACIIFHHHDKNVVWLLWRERRMQHNNKIMVYNNELTLIAASVEGTSNNPFHNYVYTQSKVITNLINFIFDWREVIIPL